MTSPRIVLESCRRAFRKGPCGDNHKIQYNWSREDIDGIDDDRLGIRILYYTMRGSMNLNVMMNICIYQNAQYARYARDTRDALSIPDILEHEHPTGSELSEACRR